MFLFILAFFEWYLEVWLFPPNETGGWGRGTGREENPGRTGEEGTDGVCIPGSCCVCEKERENAITNTSLLKKRI